MNKYLFGDVNGLDLREIAPYILEIVYQYRKSTLNDNMVWRISIAGNLNEVTEKQGFKHILWEHYDYYPMARLAEITQILSNINELLTNSKLIKGKF